MESPAIFKIFLDFVQFFPNFQILCHFLPFFWKMACITLTFYFQHVEFLNSKNKTEENLENDMSQSFLKMIWCFSLGTIHFFFLSYKTSCFIIVVKATLIHNNNWIQIFAISERWVKTRRTHNAFRGFTFSNWYLIAIQFSLQDFYIFHLLLDRGCHKEKKLRFWSPLDCLKQSLKWLNSSLFCL